MEPKLEILKNWDLKKLISELEKGEIKIPRFQRDYIWERSKVVSLLNSICSQYPIGSFFLWKASKEYNSFVNKFEDIDIPQNLDSNHSLFILDGQQRIISLYYTLKGKKTSDTDFSTICYNLDKKICQIPRLKKQKHNIPLWKIFNKEEFDKLVSEYTDFDKKNKTKYVPIINNCYDILNNYPMSIVKTYNNDLDDVVEIFERINQGGKRLSSFDLVHATTWSTKFDMKQRISDFNNAAKNKKHATISDKVFTQSLALNAFGDCRHFYQLKLTPQICDKLWNKTKKSIDYTIDFFKDMRINNDLSSYQSFIPVIQYYFFNSGEKVINGEHKKDIEKWFWDSKFSKRYLTSSFTKIKEDANWIAGLVEE